MKVLAKYQPADPSRCRRTDPHGGTLHRRARDVHVPGTAKAREIRLGDTVNTHPQADVEGAQVSSSRRAGLPVIINNVKVLSAQLKGTQGTVRRFLNTPEARDEQLAVARASSHQLASRLSDPVRSPFHEGDSPSARRSHGARRFRAHASSRRSNTSLGRIRETAPCERSRGHPQRALDHAITRRRSRGTAGRVLHDSALTNAVTEAERQMSLLFADIKKHPLRY
jgi:hypothetical protein